MPVRIGPFDDLPAAEWARLVAEKRRRANPQLEALLDAVAAGRPQRVRLEPGQRGRGLRLAIARAAERRGLAVESAFGDDFLAVWLADSREQGGGECGRPEPRPLGRPGFGRCSAAREPTPATFANSGLKRAHAR
jgi:hypothetical protein